MKKLSDKKLIDITDSAIKKYHGDADVLAKAVGMLAMARHYGWKVIYLIHTKRTIKKYEGILGVELRELVPEIGELANNSLAWKAAKKVGNFWKAVKGEIPGIRSSEIKPEKSTKGK